MKKYVIALATTLWAAVDPKSPLTRDSNVPSGSSIGEIDFVLRVESTFTLLGVAQNY